MILTWDTLIRNATPFNVIAVFIMIYITWVFLDLVQTRNMPPGPLFGWPILGHIHYLIGDDKIEQEMNLAKKYGPVFSLQIGSWRTVFVTGEKAVKEVLVKKSSTFSGRPRFPILDLLTLGGLGVGFADDGPSWRLHRRMFMSALRDFMSDQDRLQDQISQEQKIMKRYLLENAGKPLNPDHVLTLSIANVICHVAFGKHFEGTEPDYQQLIKSVHIRFTDKGITNAPANFVPWLQYFPSKVKKRAKELATGMYDPIKTYLKEHESTYDPTNIRDFTDGLIKAKEDTIAEGKQDINELLTDEHMIVTLGDMLIGGFETSVTTLLWGILYLANYPDIQHDVQDEMVRIIGTDRAPGLEDKARLPFLQATIMEIQRLGDIAPEAVPHKAIKDTTLCGYEVPRGTTVIVNLHSVHMDEKVHNEPEKFNPRRFIDSDGNVITGKGHFLPFSAGRRVCAGESLAKVELFLFLSYILHNFNIKRKDEKLISTESNYGITRPPKEYEVIFEPRNTSENFQN